MLGFAVGGVVMGRLADRVGIILPVMIGAFLLCAGYVMAALTTNIWTPRKTSPFLDFRDSIRRG